MHTVGLPVGLLAACGYANTTRNPQTMGYVTGQFGKNHLGDRWVLANNVHGFDEYWGWLYHLNAMEYTEDPDWPKRRFVDALVPRNVIYA